MNIKNDLIIKATANNNTKIVKQLLNLLKKLPNSFDIEQIRDKKGNTVLHYAAKNSNYELVKLFINKYKIDINLKNQYGQTPLMHIMKNYVSKVDNGKNLSIAEYFNERFSRGSGLLIIDSLLKSGAKFDKAEYTYLLNILENQKNKNEYVSLCENIEETLGLTSSENEKQMEHIYDIPEYSNSGQYGILDGDSEHIYEEIDELLDNKEEKLNSNMRYGDSINSDDTRYLDSSLSNDLQSDDEKGSRTPESGYRSDDQQELKIVNRQPNTKKPSIAPKPVDLQTRSPVKKMPENKTSAISIKEKILMFEKSSSLSGRYFDFESGNPNSKISLDSAKNKSNSSRAL